MVTWNATDFDNAVSSTGNTHESVSNTDNDDDSRLKQGYSYANPIAASSIIHHYPLQENSGGTAFDVEGSLDGSVNGTTQGVAGPLGTTAYNNGDDDYVVLSETSAISPGQITIMGWINGDDFSGDITDTTYAMTALGARTGNNDGILFGVSADGDGFITDEVYGITGSTNLSENTWYHIALSADNNNCTLYLNGQQEASTSGSLTFDTGRGDYIGSWEPNFTSSRSFQGSIWNVSYYDSVLSQSTIQQSYEVVATNSSLITQEKQI
jgi:hypothetical protein